MHQIWMGLDRGGKEMGGIQDQKNFGELVNTIGCIEEATWEGVVLVDGASMLL